MEFSFVFIITFFRLPLCMSGEDTSFASMVCGLASKIKCRGRGVSCIPLQFPFNLNTNIEHTLLEAGIFVKIEGPQNRKFQSYSSALLLTEFPLCSFSNSS